MNLDITARHFDLSEKAKKYIKNELIKLEKLYDGIVSCSVVLEKVKNETETEIRLSVYKRSLVTKGVSEDIFKSIDAAAEKLKRRLKKYKRKLKGFDYITPVLEEE